LYHLCGLLEQGRRRASDKVFCRRYNPVERKAFDSSQPTQHKLDLKAKNFRLQRIAKLEQSAPLLWVIKVICVLPGLEQQSRYPVKGFGGLERDPRAPGRVGFKHAELHLGKQARLKQDCGGKIHGVDPTPRASSPW
jgi:hypothetical protein